MGRVAAVAVVLVLAAVAAGCGGGDADPAEAPAPAPAPGEAALAVTLYPAGPDDGPERSAEVICPPDGPEGNEACRAIDSIEPDDADPVPPGVACTQIYGGPDLVRLEGTLHGADIEAELSRENGCEIDRFDRFAPLLEALFPRYRPGRSLTP